jgi:uncharacterized protein DUF5672
MKPVLKNVTLCAASCRDRALTARALEISLSHCEFADAVFFSDQPVQGSFRSERIEPFASLDDYEQFILTQLGKKIQTSHVLIIQWDGYVIDPESWRNEFLEYDFIGARWPWYEDDYQVGNGGFSLRSRKLLEITALGGFPKPGDGGEDHLICRTCRPNLEKEYGIRFAPNELADAFSHEVGEPDEPSFGFHGIMNLGSYVPDADLPKVLDLVTEDFYSNVQCACLVFRYYWHRRWPPLRLIYRRWCEHRSLEQRRGDLKKFIEPAVFEPFLEVCEKAFG